MRLTWLQLLTPVPRFLQMTVSCLHRYTCEHCACTTITNMLKIMYIISRQKKKIEINAVKIFS